MMILNYNQYLIGMRTYPFIFPPLALPSLTMCQPTIDKYSNSLQVYPMYDLIVPIHPRLSNATTSSWRDWGRERGCG